MNKKVLFYALGINLVTSFLGALLFKCGVDQINCGPFDVYLPIVLSGIIIIPIAYLVAKWTKRPIFFFLITLVLQLVFNTPQDSIDYHLYISGVLPSFVAVIVAWYLGKEKKMENPKPTTEK